MGATGCCSLEGGNARLGGAGARKGAKARSDPRARAARPARSARVGRRVCAAGRAPDEAVRAVRQAPALEPRDDRVADVFAHAEGLQRAAAEAAGEGGGSGQWGGRQSANCPCCAHRSRQETTQFVASACSGERWQGTATSRFLRACSIFLSTQTGSRRGGPRGKRTRRRAMRARRSGVALGARPPSPPNDGPNPSRQPPLSLGGALLCPRCRGTPSGE